MPDTKPSLEMVGREYEPPSKEDLIALYRKITGKDPSAAEIEELEAELRSNQS